MIILTRTQMETENEWQRWWQRWWQDDVGYHNDVLPDLYVLCTLKKCITSSLRLVCPISRKRRDSIHIPSQMEWLIHNMNYSNWSYIPSAATRRTIGDTDGNSVDNKVRLTKINPLNDCEIENKTKQNNDWIRIDYDNDYVHYYGNNNNNNNNKVSLIVVWYRKVFYVVVWIKFVTGGVTTTCKSYSKWMTPIASRSRSFLFLIIR